MAKKKTFAGKLVQGIKDVGKNVPFAPLLPLVPAMLVILKAKNIKTEGKGIEGVAKTFYNKVILPKKQKNFEDEQILIADKYNIEPATITLIVTAIVSFFKDLKAKKDKGKATPEEEQALKEVGKAATELDKAINKDEKEKQPAINNQMLVIGGIALIALFLIIRK